MEVNIKYPKTTDKITGGFWTLAAPVDIQGVSRL
jgi:hypothetical protein